MQVENLENGILIGEGTFLRHLAKARVDALDGIGRVHDLAYCLVDPEDQDILTTIDIVGEHDIDSGLLNAVLRAQRHIDAVDESKWVEWLEWAVLPCLDLPRDLYLEKFRICSTGTNPRRYTH